MSDYDFSVDGFSYTVDATALGLSSGSLYRFRYRAYNSLGWSDYSDILRVGLGPIPSTPAAPSRATTGSSATSIAVTWSTLTGQTLPVIEYVLYMDDGNSGLVFNEIYNTASVTSTIVTGLTPATTY